jgi:hypothetical protein
LRFNGLNKILIEARKLRFVRGFSRKNGKTDFAGESRQKSALYAKLAKPFVAGLHAKLLVPRLVT